MKKYIIIILSIISFGVNAQQRSVASGYNEEFAEKLVRTAWENHPTNQVVKKNVDVANYAKKLAGAEWLNTITLTGNMNEFNIDPERDIYNRSQFLPRYNVAANISLGVFFTIPYQRGKAKAELEVSQHLVEEQKIAHSSMVLRLYNNFVMQEQIFNIQEQALIDAENNLTLAEEKFSGGEISYEAYADIRGDYNSTLITYYESEASYKNAKITLEEFVGVALEEVQ